MVGFEGQEGWRGGEEVSTKVNGRDAASAGVLSQRSRLAGVPPSVLGGGSCWCWAQRASRTHERWRKDMAKVG